MTTRTADELVADYLERLEDELAGVPRARRSEIVREVSGHIAAARAELATESEAELRTLLDRIGDPAEIAAEAGERPVEERPGRRWVEVIALVLLLLGGFMFLIGWVVGVVLLWVSDVWTSREKLLGTLVLPFGLVLPVGFFFLAGGEQSCGTGPVRAGSSALPETTCTGGMSTGTQVLWVIAGIALFVAPFAVVAYLGRKLGRRPLAASPA
jgi:hypothetical protein